MNQLVGAAFGAAGQRCMALSTAVFVGEAKNWMPELIEMAKKLKVGSGFDPSSDLGPLISPQVSAQKRYEKENQGNFTKSSHHVTLCISKSFSLFKSDQFSNFVLFE